MPQKFDDHVLVKSCMQHSGVITREPFTHESLLIDKKEYQLTSREKEIAFREYHQDKKYFPYSAGAGSRTSFSATIAAATAYQARYPPQSNHQSFTVGPLTTPSTYSSSFGRNNNNNNQSYAYNNGTNSSTHLISHSMSMGDLLSSNEANNTNVSYFQNRPINDSNATVSNRNGKDLN